MRRILLFAAIGFIVIAIVIVVVTLVSRRRQAPDKTTAPTKQGEVTLTIWRYQDDEAVFKNLISQFQTQFPDIKIEYVKKELANYELDATNALAAGSGPDIWSIPNDWLKRHADKLIAASDGALATDRSDRRQNNKIVEDRYVPVVGKEVIINNKVYGLPLNVDTLALYLNTQEISKAVNEKPPQDLGSDLPIFTTGPRTWDELVKVIKTLAVRTKDQVQRSIIGLGSGSNVSHSADILAAIMIQNRSQMISPDGLTASFNLPARKSTGAEFNPGLQALEFYTAFANPAKEVFNWTANFPDAQASFLDGKTMMVFGYSDFDRTIKQVKPQLRYNVVPFPQIAGARQAVDFASYPVETVTKNAENPEAAWRFVKFVAGSGLQEYLSVTRRPSPLKAQIVPQTILDRLTFGSPFQFQQQTALSWDRGKNPDGVEEAFRKMIDDVVARGVNSQVALDAAAKQTTEILREAAGFEARPVEDQ